MALSLLQVLSRLYRSISLQILPEVSPKREQRYTVTPNPSSADADDDFGFSETSSFFEDAKTYDPVSGTDVK